MSDDILNYETLIYEVENSSRRIKELKETHRIANNHIKEVFGNKIIREYCIRGNESRVFYREIKDKLDGAWNVNLEGVGYEVVGVAFETEFKQRIVVKEIENV